MILSKEERSAEELLLRIRHLIARLPRWMGIRCAIKRREIVFAKIGSRIFTLPAVPEAVRLYTPTVVVWDEMAFTREAERIWEALSPALDSSARFVGISTPNGRFTTFGRLVQKPDQFGFSLHRIHYRERPDRGDAWRTEKQKELSESEWRREYELSLEEINGLRVIEEFVPSVHIESAPLSKKDVLQSPRLFRSIDYGYRTPVVLWIAERADNRLTVFDEWIGDNATRDDLLAAIRAIDRKWGISDRNIEWTACDPAGAQHGDTGIPVVDFLAGAGIRLMFRKSRIEDGLDIVRTYFRRADGGSVLKVSPLCTKLILDLESYTYDERTGKPIKGNYDHTIDALRYFCLSYMVPTPAKRKVRVAGSKR